MIKPYSESCDQNKWPILEVIQPLLISSHTVLEIGSGTGQHAVFFAEQMPYLDWYTSDRDSYHEGINAWLNDANLKNTHSPLSLDVSDSVWPDIDIDAIFTANAIHIMKQHDVTNLLTGAGNLLTSGGLLLIYGPFNYNGQYTSESNKRFDQWLHQRDIESGIKDCESVVQLAKDNGMQLYRDFEMPQNNRLLAFHKG